MGIFKFVALITFMALLMVPSAFSYTITGTVLNERDDPVQGATVAIHYYATHGLLQETTTNGQGTFRLEIPSHENTYYVRIEHPMFQIFEEPYFFTMYEEFRDIHLRVYLAEYKPAVMEHTDGRMRIFADAFPRQAPNPFIGFGIIAAGLMLGLVLRRAR